MHENTAYQYKIIYQEQLLGLLGILACTLYSLKKPTRIPSKTEILLNHDFRSQSGGPEFHLQSKQFLRVIRYASSNRACKACKRIWKLCSSSLFLNWQHIFMHPMTLHISPPFIVRPLFEHPSYCKPLQTNNCYQSKSTFEWFDWLLPLCWWSNSLR